MRFFVAIAELFENWINPLAPVKDLRPPQNITGYVWHYLRQAKLPFFFVLIAGGLSALLDALFFYYIGRLVDILDTTDFSGGWQGLFAQHGNELALMLSVVLFGRVAISVFTALLNQQVIGRNFYNLIRWQSYKYVARQSLAFFTNEFSGSVVTKVSQAGGSLGDLITGVIQVVWTMTIFAATTLILFAQLDLRLAGIVVIWIIVFLVLARVFLPTLRQRATENAEARSMLNGRIVDSYSNIQTLKLFGQAEENDAYVEGGFQNMLHHSLRLGRISISLNASMVFLSSAVVSATAILSIDLWLREAITVGSVAFAMALVLRLESWLGQLMGGISGLMRNYGVVQNAMETISRPLGVVDAPDAIDWTPSRGAIQFNDVGFKYSANREVIEHLNLDIAPGEKVGLVGKSGAGKTTLVNLLLRFYDLDSGSILIDGQDISRVKQDALRQGIGVVTQDSSLLHRSVRDNIKFGRPDASEEDMIAAARQAEAHQFIQDLEDNKGRKGYDAHVGERGIKLSGGQRQRIAIARVLLKDAPILVLDEATSALDSEVEAAIQSQLEQLMRGKTVIAIAHRLSTIAAMDRLIILDEGKIIEQGPHQALLDASGHYAILWARQSGGFLNADNSGD